MLMMHIKRIFRNRWLLIKMFIVSPLVKILPIILIQNTLGIMSESMIINLCLWSLFYFSAFESVNMKMKLFSSEKISEIMMSRTSLLRYHFNEATALNIAFLPSYIFTLSLYSLIYHIHLNIEMIITCTLGILICNFLLMMVAMILELRFSNYFNKFNLAINVINVLCGITYPITVFPIIFQNLSYLIPLSYIFQYSNESNIQYLMFFVISVMIAWIIISTLLIYEERNYLKRGGTV